MPHPPRVLTFIHSYEPGGVEKVAMRLAAAWSSSGMPVRFIVGRDTGIAPACLARCDVEILDKRGWTRRFETLWMIASLPARVRAYRPDVIFCAGNTYAIVALGLKLLSFGRCPPVFCKVSNDLARLDQPASQRWLYRVWLRLQGRFIDHFIGMYEPTRDEIIDAMGISDARVSIIDDPALATEDIVRLAEARQRRGTTGPGRHFLGIGRLVPQKNFALLIEAFAAIASGGDRLTIVGDGPERLRLEHLINRLGLADRVELPGHSDQVGSWLAESSVFVLSSNYEGVPAVIIEALAAGLSIVATDCSVSMRSLLDGGRLGTLVTVGDRAALSRAMDGATITAACAASAEAKVSQFTIERAAPRYAQVFRRTRQSVPALGAVAQFS
ncbi:glycosyltransferase [Sphingosinicellaceae bacterium]|nr:glycosyltransferase [Sphingosinicellaceae bacterium]